MENVNVNVNREVLRNKRRNNIRKNVVGTALVAAPVIGFCAFTLFPMLVSFIISFTELHSYNIRYATWAGFSNYVTIFDSSLLWTSIKNTLLFCLCVPINLTVAVFLANIISKKMVGSKVMRVILFLPQVCSGVAVTLMWQWIFEDNFGVINTVLAGLDLKKIPWLTDANYFTIAVLVISLWQHGTNVIILESAFLNVNTTIQEAARLDGANEFQVFWKVTFPALTPAIFYLFTTWLIAALQEQTVMQIITTNGVGPSYRALTLVYYIYRMAFAYTASMGMGMACALSWVTAIFIMLITRLLFWSSKFWVKYDY